MLWENIDKTQNNEINKNEVQIISSEKSFKPRSIWVPPNFGKLPTPDVGLKSVLNSFSMRYNGEEKKRPNSVNANIFSSI